MADSPARVLIGGLDQLANGVLAVADDGCRDSLGNGCDLATDHQAPVVVPGDVRLDHDLAGTAFPDCALEGRRDRLVRSQIEVDAPPVVTIERLDDAREAEPSGRRDGRLGGVDNVCAWHRQAGRIEQPVGQALVRRDVDSNAGRP